MGCLKENWGVAREVSTGDEHGWSGMVRLLSNCFGFSSADFGEGAEVFDILGLHDKHRDETKVTE